jgi:hypothetical protein
MSTRSIDQIIASNTLSAEALDTVRGGNGNPIVDGLIGWVIGKAADAAVEHGPAAAEAMDQYFADHYQPSEYEQSQQAAQDQAHYAEMTQMMDDMSGQGGGGYDGGGYDGGGDDGGAGY